MADDSTRPEVPAVGETLRRGYDVSVSTDGARSTFTVTTSGLARDGMVLEAGGVDVDAFRANPVVLWDHGHDFMRGNLPIGRAAEVRRNGDTWEADVEWGSDEFSTAVSDMVRDGFLNAVSIGWRTLDAGWETRDGAEVYVIRRAEMVEFSVVAVPADAKALVTARTQQEEGLRAVIRRLVDEAVRDAMPEPTDTVEAPTVTVDTDAVIEAATRAPDPAPDPPAPRAATPEEYAALAVQIAHAARAAHNTVTQRALGRA